MFYKLIRIFNLEITKRFTMIKKLLSFGFALTAIGFASIYMADTATPYTSGPPAAKTGSPGDNGNCTDCHSGTPTNQTGMITTNIPGTGYLSDSTYTITATVSVSNLSKFGFQVSPQNTAGQQRGTLIVTNSTQTQLVSGTKYIEHKTAGTSGSGSKTWTFNWKAPAPNSGAVTFYGAFIGANSNSASSGDQCFLSSTTVQQDPLSGTIEYLNERNVSVYPTPFSDVINVAVSASITSSVVSIYSLSGTLVYSGAFINGISTINASTLQSGIYIINIAGEEGHFSKKIVKL